MPPKKIYRHKFTDENGVVHTVTRHIKTGDKDIVYILADIVDELVEALELALVKSERFSYPWLGNIRKALALLADE